VTQQPIACSLDPSAFATRKAGLLADLARRATTRTPLDDGARLTFTASSETLDLIARAIDAERQCCQFLRFHLTIEPALGAFMLDLTGPAGTQEFLDTLLNSA
jgi:hypothetical protein